MYYANTIIKNNQETNPSLYRLDSKQNRESRKGYMKFIMTMVMLQTNRKMKTTTINGIAIFGFSPG